MSKAPTAPVGNSQTDPSNQPIRISDSVWFWLAIYCGFGSIILAGYGYLPLLLRSPNSGASVEKNDSQAATTVIDSNEEQLTRDDRSNLAARILSPTLCVVALFSIGMLYKVVLKNRVRDGADQSSADHAGL